MHLNEFGFFDTHRHESPGAIMDGNDVRYIVFL